MRRWLRLVILAALASGMVGCGPARLSTTPKGLPKVYQPVDEVYAKKRKVKVTVFTFANYTDAPDAGRRAANLAAGELQSRGYSVTVHLKKRPLTLKKARKLAKKDKSRYFLIGGVSEWRYKNGIDSEPAVSLRMTLYRTKDARPVWSATGSDTDWGNESLGVTAQGLIANLFDQ